MSRGTDDGARLVRDRDRPDCFVLRFGRSEQSFVDPADPTYLEFDYTNRIVEAVDAWRPPPARVRAVHVGGGALTLPRYLAATRPTSPQVVLEPDAALIDEVRAAIPLPPRSGIKVRPVDGRAGLAALADGYAELVIVDVFAGSQVPPDFATRQLFAECRRVVAAAGLLVMNVTDVAPFAWGKRVVAGAREAFGEVALGGQPATLKGRRFGNLIIVAGDTVPIEGLVRSAAGGAFPYRWLDPTRTASWVGGNVPFDDGVAQPSPPPGDATFLG